MDEKEIKKLLDQQVQYMDKMLSPPSMKKPSSSKNDKWKIMEKFDKKK